MNTKTPLAKQKDQSAPAAASLTATDKRGAKVTDQKIYSAIYDAVMDHRLPPGTRLTESALGDFFGVSRTVVRKALTRLAHENILRLRPNRGAVVSSPSVEETRDVFQARRLIEGEVIRLVARSINKDQLKALRTLAKEEHEAYERGDYRNWVRLSGRFHAQLAEISGNTVLVRFVNELVSRTSLIIALYEAPGAPSCTSDDHDRLIEAVARGDEEQAAAIMSDHLLACEKRLNLSKSDKPIDLADIFGSHTD